MLKRHQKGCLLVNGGARLDCEPSGMASWMTVSRGYPSTSAALLMTSSPFSGRMAICRQKHTHTSAAEQNMSSQRHNLRCDEPAGAVCTHRSFHHPCLLMQAGAAKGPHVVTGLICDIGAADIQLHMHAGAVRLRRVQLPHH